MTKILVLEDDNDIETFFERLQNQSWNDISYNHGQDNFTDIPNNLKDVDFVVLKAPSLKHHLKKYGKVFFGKMAIDFSTKTVSIKNFVISLTRKEYDLLEILARNSKRYVSESEILDYVWGDDNFILSNTVRVHIARLRKKLEKPHGCKFIKTSKGFGYKLVVEN